MIQKSDYNQIFTAVEQSVYNRSTLAADVLQGKLEPFKQLANKPLTDNDCFFKLVLAVFFAGIKAETVNRRIDTIYAYFSDWQRAAAYNEADIEAMIADPKMLGSRRKIQGCVWNGRIFGDILAQHGSFAAYLDNFRYEESFENLMLLKEELQYRFSGLGPITIYHFMTELGLPVLKPDRVVCRIFKRLGLIEDTQQLLKAVIQGRKMATAINQPIRYVDIIFVVHGQAQNSELGIQHGVCTENNPACHLCMARPFCQYYQEKQQENV